MSEKYDIVIVGAGPIGLMLSACLSRLGSYKIKHIDNRAEPTSIGRADGIQARTLDVLQSMGLKRPIWAFDPGLIYEVVFWGATPDGNGIQRTGTSKSYPDHIDTRYPFTTILHQGRIEGIFLEDLRSHGVEVQRPWTVRAYRFHGQDSEYPVDVDIVGLDGLDKETVRTKYLFGADGARSTVRELLKIPMLYKDPTVHVWSVIDGVVKTDFPDMQVKCTIRSPRGSCMVIPQGNNRVRIYVQITPEEDKGQSASASQAKIQRMANEILCPYHVEWEIVDWHSSYHIGQGISQRYSSENRIFIGGDACHTHSPKAGQGMNYGLLDAHNLAWKLHLVESGLMQPYLLNTYEGERRQAAERLIEFDATYAGLFSSHDPSKQTDDEFVRILKQNSLLLSGYGVEYPANALTVTSDNDLFGSSLNGLQPGRNFPPANVTRVIDAREVSLERDIPFNGSFRIYIFAGEQQPTGKPLMDLTEQLTRGDSTLSQFLVSQPDLSYDGRHNPHSKLFTFSLVFNSQRAMVELASLPDLFASYRYHVYSDESRSRKFFTEGQGMAHVKMGFDLREGGVVVVRPDGYVGCVVKLEEGRKTAEALDQYFSRFVPSIPKSTTGWD